MLHSHGVGGTLVPGFPVDAFGDLHFFDLHRGNAHCLMDRHRAPHADGNAVFIRALKGKPLPKAAHIHPFFTCGLRINVSVLDSLGGRRSPIAQAFAAVIAAVIGLHKNCISHILHTVADLPLDAHIRDLPHAVIVGPGAVAVQRVTVAVCVGHRDQRHKVDFVFQSCHNYSSSILSSVPFLVKNAFRCSS